MLRFTLLIIVSVLLNFNTVFSQTYKIVDTGQEKFFNNQNEISAPAKDEAFFGQDAQFTGNEPNYTDNGDGTVTDNVTGLMWSKSPDLNGDGVINVDDKLTYPELLEYVKTFSLAGYDDWRIPTIKELYSLVNFSGIDPSGPNPSNFVPFIDTDYFEFGYGDESAGERLIDAQMATTTFYKGEALMSDEIMFGYNFADGRIKGYPYGEMPNGEMMDYYVYFVRGTENYGINDFEDNGDGTISDKATGLMWMQDDSKEGMNWEEALKYAETKNSEDYLGYNDWRLPNAKELQSIVDYERSPQSTNSPAIDPIFTCSEITDEGGNKNYPFYWTGTTHNNYVNAINAVYICFGEALGFMEMPPNSGNYNLMDVHGAGAQRSDPKTGNPDDYPNGFGPQGDVIRIYNYVRLVRGGEVIINSIEQNDDSGMLISPNPASEYIEISINKPSEGFEPSEGSEIEIYDVLGNVVVNSVASKSTSVPINRDTSAGGGQKRIDISHLPDGLYFIQIGNYSEKFVVVR